MVTFEVGIFLENRGPRVVENPCFGVPNAWGKIGPQISNLAEIFIFLLCPHDPFPALWVELRAYEAPFTNGQKWTLFFFFTKKILGCSIWREMSTRQVSCNSEHSLIYGKYFWKLG